MRPRMTSLLNIRLMPGRLLGLRCSMSPTRCRSSRLRNRLTKANKNRGQTQTKPHGTGQSWFATPVCPRKWRILGSKDALHQVLHVASLKGVLEGHHFIEYTTQGPNVALVIVAFLQADLWAQVVRGAWSDARDETKHSTTSDTKYKPSATDTSHPIRIHTHTTELAGRRVVAAAAERTDGCLGKLCSVTQHLGNPKVT